MRRWLRLVLLLFPGLILLPVLPAPAQTAKPEAQPPHAVVMLYRIAPGKHLDFLKWMATNEAIAKEAGVPGSQLYAHVNGDSWDYMLVAPALSDAQEAKVDEITKKRGGKTGFPASLEFRTFVAWHTDTDVIGPVTASELVAAAGK